jgi:two-component system nitrate/nitrite response regulator NarL
MTMQTADQKPTTQATTKQDGTIRLLVVDDHAMFRESLVRMLEKEPEFLIAGQAGSVSEALLILARTRPAVVLLDVDLGAERAIDFALGARTEGFEGRILAVTAGMSDPEAIQLVQAGVTGIVHKHNSIATLRDVIVRVAGGEVSIEKPYLAAVLRSMDRTRKPEHPALTPRDRAVVNCVLQGLINRDIAVKLGISEGAAKASLRLVCAKLGVRTRSQLVKVALEHYRDQL